MKSVQTLPTKIVPKNPLPSDLLLDICLFLDCNNAYKLKLVSLSWSKIITNLEHLMPKIFYEKVVFSTNFTSVGINHGSVTKSFRPQEVYRMFKNCYIKQIVLHDYVLTTEGLKGIVEKIGHPLNTQKVRFANSPSFDAMSDIVPYTDQLFNGIIEAGSVNFITNSLEVIQNPSCLSMKYMPKEVIFISTTFRHVYSVESQEFLNLFMHISGHQWKYVFTLHGFQPDGFIEKLVEYFRDEKREKPRCRMHFRDLISNFRTIENFLKAIKNVQVIDEPEGQVIKTTYFLKHNLQTLKCYLSYDKWRSGLSGDIVYEINY